MEKKLLVDLNLDHNQIKNTDIGVGPSTVDSGVRLSNDLAGLPRLRNLKLEVSYYNYPDEYGGTPMITASPDFTLSPESWKVRLVNAGNNICTPIGVYRNADDPYYVEFKFSRFLQRRVSPGSITDSRVQKQTYDIYEDLRECPYNRYSAHMSFTDNNKHVFPTNDGSKLIVSRYFKLEILANYGVWWNYGIKNAENTPMYRGLNQYQHMGYSEPFRVLFIRNVEKSYFSDGWHYDYFISSDATGTESWINLNRTSKGFSQSFK